MPTPEARAHRRKLAGIVLCVWLAGSIVGGAIGWYVSERNSAELRHDHNALVCVFRSIVVPQRARAVQAEGDETQSESARARARSTVKNSNLVLKGLLTIPPGYDCSKFVATTN